MNTIDFTSVPLIGDLMKVTGVGDGWLIVSALLAVMLLLCIIGIIVGACRSRSQKKELLSMRRELLGLQALTSLPPLHQKDSGDSGESLVFASFEELKERQIENAREQRAAYNAQLENERAQALAALREREYEPRYEDYAAAMGQEPAPAAYDVAGYGDAAPGAYSAQDAYAPATQASDNVTAQVHDAIYASVTGRLEAVKPQDSRGASSRAARPKRAKGAPITGADIPQMRPEGNAAPRGAAPYKGPAPGSDLSGRIPRL